jgi:uncharacterized membrane protein YjjB (DUF3815 family)
MGDDNHEPAPVRTLGWYIYRGLRKHYAHRPTSFYMLLATPVVLLLSVDMIRHQDDPKRFFLVLALLMVFFGIGLVRAVMDILEITRSHLTEHRETFQKTLGDEHFMARLKEGAEHKDDHE